MVCALNKPVPFKVVKTKSLGEYEEVVMGHGIRVKKSFAVAFIFIILLVVAPALVLAAEADKKDNRPERGIAV
jgi:hypothetical protein